MKNNVIIKALSLAIAVVFSLSSTVFAQDANLTKLVEQLQQQMSSMQQTINSQNAKIAQLESSAWEGPAKEIKGPSSGMTEEQFKKALTNELGKDYGTFKDLKFKGDLRLRYEAFDYTNGLPTETDPRNRFRYRLRMGLDKKFNDEWKAGFRLASGGTTDPTSTNETLDGNFVNKSITIDQVYATYTPNWGKKGALEKTEITAGKFKNPFEKGSSDMVWDRDVTPEGIYESFDFRLLDTEDVKMTGWFTAGQLILDEDGTANGDRDAELYAFQLGLNPKFKIEGLEKPLGWTSALSFYNYSDYAKSGNFGAFANANPAAGTNLLANDFNIIEIYNELNIPVLGMPVRPWFDIARNMSEKASPITAAGGQDMAWGLGVNIGKAKKKGEWELGYAYKNIEANSVVGAFNDSDFGNGFVDKRGSVFKAKYMVTDFLEAGATAIFVNNISNLLRDEEQRRFQMDLVWKW